MLYLLVYTYIVGFRQVSWKILISYFIYWVVKAREPVWCFVKKFDWGRASFLCYWHLKLTPEKTNYYISISNNCWPKRGSLLVYCYAALFSDKFLCYVVAVIEVEQFHIDSHCHAASFSRKLYLCETHNIFHSREYSVWHNDNNKFWKFIQNEYEVTFDGFWNFAYVSIYLHSKSFAWKWDYIISQKLQMPHTSPRPFQKALIKFY